MAEKKSIIIVSHAMEIGGAERALLGLLDSIDKTKYTVDLFLMRHSGEFLDKIPEGVHLLPEIKEYTGLAVPMFSLFKKKLFSIAYGRLKAKRLAKRYIRRKDLKDCECVVELEYSHKYTKKYMPDISGKTYDLAISFLTPHYFVSEKINAKKKIAWIHNDYSFVNLDVESELKMWSAYDYIASISDDCTKGFCSKFPELADRLFLIENISSPSLINKQADEFDPAVELSANDSIVLLSVGRYCYQKNFDNVPEICRYLLDKGLNVKWFLIGFGSFQSTIKEKITQFDVENNVILLGKKTNPYPYMKYCDIYVQPSRYEGKAVTVREAQILNKPVVITNYATSSSQLTGGYDGVVVPLDNEGCAEGIAKVIRDKDLQRKLIENTKKNDYTNKSEIEKLYSLID